MDKTTYSSIAQRAVKSDLRTGPPAIPANALDTVVQPEFRGFFYRPGV